MVRLLFSIIMLVVSNASANDSEELYERVNLIHEVANWLRASERGFNTVEIETKIESDSNRMITIVKNIARPEGIEAEQHNAFILAHTQKFLVLVSVEHNQMRMYFGAGVDSQKAYGEEKFEDFIERMKSQKQYNLELTGLIEELNSHLGRLHGVRPILINKSLDVSNSLKVGGYTLTRMNFNDEVSESLLEDFLLMTWSVVEKGVSYPSSLLLNSKSCESYLAL